MSDITDFNYKMIIQYDGSRYRGWQILKSTDDTIQGKLKSVLSKLLDEDIEVIGSGRTDAGVHALSQVANFHTTKMINENLFLTKLNHYLPQDIAVISLQRADLRFHARYNAKSKTYRYRIHTGEISNVFERKYMYYYDGAPLDVCRMKSAAKLLLGEHDFMCFCNNKHIKKSSVRNIYSIDICVVSNNEISIEFTGDGFLQNMVRIMSGTLIEVGNGSRRVEDIPSIIESRQRELAGFMAPSEGLCLINVEY